MPVNQPLGDYRAEACVGALLHVLGSRESAMRYLTFHPNGDALQSTLAGMRPRSFPTLLWRELAEYERNWLPEKALAVVPQDHSTANYYRRRRELIEWMGWRGVVSTLPSVFQLLFDLPALRIEKLCAALGLEMIATFAGASSDAQCEAMLAPLGRTPTAWVMNEISRMSGRSVELTISSAWQHAYTIISRQRTGRDIAFTLGRSLAATLYQQLTIAQREVITRSRLHRVVSDTRTFDTTSESQLRAIWQFVEHVIGGSRADVILQEALP